MADILSVGIDIGTSTTQLVFSRISMKNTVGYFSVPQISIVAKEVLYKSKVYTTPLISLELIDGDRIREIVAAEYALAGFKPSDVDTGAVIITGESARKENAALVLSKLSEFAGDFVVSTAGPDLESVIAGKGSGAYLYSLENHAVVANLDIGGGTTNIVIFDDGAAVSKSCLDIGGRLIRVKDDGSYGPGSGWLVESVSPSAAKIAEAAGVRIAPGSHASASDLSKITNRMAELLAEELGIGSDPYRSKTSGLLDQIRTPSSSRLETVSGSGKRIEKICFSGGVADQIHDPSPQDIPYGDIGVFLGRSIRKSSLMSIPVLQGSETIRATVVGAGTYTTTISGSTISYGEGLFPVKNIPALKLSMEEQQRCLAAERGFLEGRIRWFRDQSSSDNIMLALAGMKDPSYLELKGFAAYLAEELDRALMPGSPVIVVLEQDMAKALGILLQKQLAGRRSLICLDGIHVEQGDYVDMGRPIMNGLVIPVVVKTLLLG